VFGFFVATPGSQHLLLSCSTEMKIINTLMGVRIMTPSTSLDLFDHGFPEKTTEPLSLLSPCAPAMSLSFGQYVDSFLDLIEEHR
jgi:hypothetical protein